MHGDFGFMMFGQSDESEEDDYESGSDENESEEDEKSEEEEIEQVADSDSDDGKIAIEGFEDDVKYDKVEALADFVRVRKSDELEELQFINAEDLKSQKKEYAVEVY
jgi:hypothetical protein